MTTSHYNDASPFVVATGVDEFPPYRPTVHLGFHAQRWSLTPFQARQLGNSLLHAAHRVATQPAAIRGSR